MSIPTSFPGVGPQPRLPGPRDGSQPVGGDLEPPRVGVKPRDESAVSPGGGKAKNAAPKNLPTPNDHGTWDISDLDAHLAGLDQAGGAAGPPGISPAAEARQMRGAFNKLAADTEYESGRTTDQNLKDVNDFTANDQETATAMVAANQRVENAQLGKLTESQRGQYQAVKGAIAKDALAQLALQGMLGEGRLTGGPLDAKGQDLLTNLDRMAKQEVAGMLDRDELVADTIQELHSPGAISQRNRTTCGPTTVQIKTAMDGPAEYARLVGDLASPAGKAELANGDSFERAVGTENPDNSRRSQSARLFQGAAMQYGESGRYDNKNDEIRGPNRVLKGMSQAGVSRALSGIGNQGVDTVLAKDFDQAAFDRLAASANAGHPVPVAIEWGTEGHTLHEVLVTKVTKDTVHYANPWGMRESMSVAEFKDRKPAASLPILKK